MKRKPHKTTPEIEKEAEKIGATPTQILTWRYRGVANGWRQAIVAASRGRIKLEDFPEKAI